MVVMGRIAAPFGVKGWVRIHTYTAAPRNLLDYRNWWIGEEGDWRELPVVEGKVQARALVAKLEGCEDRDAAASLRGRTVAVPREALPRTQADEHYWADLIGLRVVNAAAEDLGRVTGILQTGANDVLVVEGGRERLIPFIAEVIRDVDLGRGVVRVEWGADY
ncbi:MAG: ribosome maturation factor RimM [Betaproteobacteria bacterium]|nr:ribosome maturation factor RimM [Betaproteobacteria bacterium]